MEHRSRIVIIISWSGRVLGTCLQGVNGLSRVRLNHKTTEGNRHLRVSHAYNAILKTSGRRSYILGRNEDWSKERGKRNWGRKGGGSIMGKMKSCHRGKILFEWFPSRARIPMKWRSIFFMRNNLKEDRNVFISGNMWKQLTGEISFPPRYGGFILKKKAGRRTERGRGVKLLCHVEINAL